MKKISLASMLAATLAVGTGCPEPPAAGLAPGSHPQSGRLAISPDGSTLYVALADHDQVRAIDAATGEVTGQVDVAGSPHRLTVLSDGRLAVTARYAGTVNIIDAEARQVEHSTWVGVDPFGVVEADGKVVVALSGQSELARLDLDNLDAVEDRVALDEPDPRGLAVRSDGRLYVSHFKSPRLSAVDLATGTPSGSVELAMAANPQFQANQLESITVTPDESELVVPHVECNNDPVQFGAGGTDLSGGASVQEYYAMGPTGYPAVLPAISRVDAESGLHLSDGPGAYDQNFPEGQPETAGPAPAVISPLDTARIGNNRINAPTAVALADGGKLELLVNRGSGNVFVRRAVLGEGDRSLYSVYDVGVGASDIVLSPDGSTAYVYNEFTYEISSFAVPSVESTSRSSGASLGQFAADAPWRGDVRTILRPDVQSTYKVAEDVLPDDVRQGRILFHSVTPNLTRQGAVSCASCHPGGQDDGTTWHFAEGPRQTPPLWGGLSETEPLHWDNSFDDMNTINQITVQMRMGGEGLNPTQLSALTAFIDTIPVPAAPMNASADSVDRGRNIFFSDGAGCTECHYGEHYTDNQSHDVGTGWGDIDGETRSLFATPPLHGLAHSAPYLHSGTARSLRDVIDQLVATDRMGRGSHLSEQDKDDLAAFLSTL